MLSRLKTKKEIETLADGGKILARILRELKKASRPGVSTLFLNTLAKKLIKENGAEAIFETYKAPWSEKRFGFSLCTSLN